MDVVEVQRGDCPVILAMPHTGTFVPDEITKNLNETGQALGDTDWYVDQLYKGLLPSASTVRATFHRYVIDANRDPTGQTLYPGRNTTGLCPLSDFDNKHIYQEGCEPLPQEIERRRLAFHYPYHKALENEIIRVKDLYGVAVLYDCHSIRSKIPHLFDGVLPDFNIGTNQELSCAREIQRAVSDICNEAKDFSAIVNGRFTGGWTTRHYGRPHIGVHAIQMELAQSSYMDERFADNFRPERAEKMRHHLRQILLSLEKIAYQIASQM